MGHGDLSDVNPRGATGGGGETIAERILRQEEESRQQLAREEEQRQVEAGSQGPPLGDSTGIDNQARRILMTLPDGTILYFDEWNTFVNGLGSDYQGYFGSVDSEIGVQKAIQSINNYWNNPGQTGDGTGQDPNEFNIDDFLASLLGPLGGGGGGRVGPTYVKPDEATVGEGLGLYVSTVVGEENGDILAEAISIYMKSHRANFDNKGQQIDATTAAKEYVRGTAAYKDIHELRPENMDELRWVTTTQGQLRKLGVNPGRTEKLGIELARIAASEQSVQKAGETAFSRQTGRIHQDQRNRLKAKASAAAQLL